MVYHANTEQDRDERTISKIQFDKPVCELSHVAVVEVLHCMAGVVVEIYIREMDFSDLIYHDLRIPSKLFDFQFYISIHV